MQISMEMLCGRLGKFDPEPDIRENKRHLQNVRLFSENLRFSSSTAYLMPVEHDRVICSNENDILVLHSDDINEVLNEILDAFEYYNEFESEAFRRIEEGCSDTELLEMLSGLTGFFMILADTGFYMRATAGPEELRDCHPGLTGMIGERMLPYAALEEISSQPYVRRRDMPPYLTEVPGLGTACVTNLFTGPEHAGWLISCGRTAAFSPAEKDRVDCAGRIAEYWLSRNQNIREQSRKSGMLLNLLNGTEKDDGKIEERLSTFGWMPADEKQVFVLRQKGETQISPEALMRRLELLYPDAFVLQHEGDVILLLNYALTGREGIRQPLQEMLGDCRCTAGESEVFRDIWTLPENIRTAAMTADLMPGETGRIYAFRDALLPYAVHILKEHAGREMLHPALQILREYDISHDGELLHTLRVFLRERGSYTAAAKELYIHRSTLIYRMEKIEALTRIDLNDPDERFLLQLSYYVMDAG